MPEDVEGDQAIEAFSVSDELDYIPAPSSPRVDVGAGSKEVQESEALQDTDLLFHRHENIIAILDMIPPTSYETFTEVYLVQELMETDL